MVIYNKVYTDIFTFHYPIEGLSPTISTTITKLHYDYHFAGYVSTLNKLLTNNVKLQNKKLKEIVIESYGDYSLLSIYNNSAQVLNHIIYWSCLNPISSKPGLNTLSLIEKNYQSFNNFVNCIEEQGSELFGSGWLWVVLTTNNKISILTTINAFSPINMDTTKEILIGIDLWEHAYYLDYLSKRKDYLKNIISFLIDWNYVEEKLLAHVV